MTDAFFEPMTEAELRRVGRAGRVPREGRRKTRLPTESAQRGGKAEDAFVKLLLDTCTLIWLMTGERRLPDRVLRDLATAVMSFVSAASAWEIAIKHAKGALRLSQPPRPARARRPCPLRVSSRCRSTRNRRCTSAKLPPLHADPFDRMLVSQAIVHGLTIVTPDPLVTQYPARTMW